MEVDEADLLAQFKEVDVELEPGSEVFQKCASLCQKLKFTPRELAEEWEAYAFNSRVAPDTPTVKALENLYISKMSARQFQKSKAPPPAKVNVLSPKKPSPAARLKGEGARRHVQPFASPKPSAKRKLKLEAEDMDVDSSMNSDTSFSVDNAMDVDMEGSGASGSANSSGKKRGRQQEVDELLADINFDENIDFDFDFQPDNSRSGMEEDEGEEGGTGKRRRDGAEDNSAKRKKTKQEVHEELLSKIDKKTPESGTSVLVFNEALTLPEEPHGASAVSITFPYESLGKFQKKRGTVVRYMYDQLQDRTSRFEAVSQELRLRLEREMLAENVLEASEYDEAVQLAVSDQIRPFHLFHQHRVVVAARVGKDLLHDGEAALFLEGSHAEQAIRTRVSFDRLSSYSVFPGQVIAVKGSNPTSKLFLAAAIRPPQALPPFETNSHDEGLRVMAAAGPYTTVHNLSYKPLEFLMEQVVDREPDLLVLNGPFVDEIHPSVAAGDVIYENEEESFSSLFSILLEKILATLKPLKTLLVVVPSMRDVHHHMHVYPQPRFTFSHPLLGQKVFMVDDPSTFSVNHRQVTFGVTSADPLIHIAQQEQLVRPQDGAYDRITGLARHLVQQASYYPLHPPKKGHCVDSQNLDRVQMHERVPNILLLPSDFAPFVKSIDGQVLCVNPGRVGKGTTGTFALITILRPSASEDTAMAGGHEESMHSLLQRTRVDIIRV